MSTLVSFRLRVWHSLVILVATDMAEEPEIVISSDSAQIPQYLITGRWMDRASGLMLALRESTVGLGLNFQRATRAHSEQHNNCRCGAKLWMNLLIRQLIGIVNVTLLGDSDARLTSMLCHRHQSENQKVQWIHFSEVVPMANKYMKKRSILFVIREI